MPKRNGWAQGSCSREHSLRPICCYVIVTILMTDITSITTGGILEECLLGSQGLVKMQSDVRFRAA